MARSSLALVALVCALLSPSRASAYEEQLTLAISSGYTHALGAVADHGAMLDLAGGFGLDPVWTLRLRAAYALHPESEPVHLALGAVELLYVVDILEVVPYFGLGLGGMASVRDGETDGDLTAGPVFGADYLLTRELALEFDVRANLRFRELDGDPLYLAFTGGVVLFFDL